MLEGEPVQRPREGTTPERVEREVRALWDVRERRALYENQKALLLGYAERGCPLPYYDGWSAADFRRACALLAEKEQQEELRLLATVRTASRARLQRASGAESV